MTPDQESRLVRVEERIRSIMQGLVTMEQTGTHVAEQRADLRALNGRVERMGENFQRDIERVQKDVAQLRAELSERDEKVRQERERRDELEAQRDDERRRYEKQQRDDAVRSRATLSVAAFVAFLILVGTILTAASGI